MSKFDRGVFIFIGLGIWVLAMSQIFAPKIADAGLSAIQPIKSIVTGKCPDWIKNKIIESGSTSGTPTEVCFYQLTASIEDLVARPDYFR